MAKPKGTFEPMTLRNMRANGVRSLSVRCDGCHHEAVISLDQYPDEATVTSFGPRMACTACGKIGADARPNWGERENGAGGPSPFGRSSRGAT